MAAEAGLISPKSISERASALYLCDYEKTI